MYIKLINSQPQSYSVYQLRKDNPQVSFPKEPSDTLLAEYDIYPVTQTPSPTVSPTQVAESAGYTQRPDGTWATAWTIRPMFLFELQGLQEVQESLRQSAYVQEADPLFFKWQRGESEQQVWLDKIAEIKNRYPNFISATPEAAPEATSEIPQ